MFCNSMIVGETLAGIFLLGSFFAAFFTGPQRGSETCTDSFKIAQADKKEARAEVIARIERIKYNNTKDMLKKTRSLQVKRTVRRTLPGKGRRGGMGGNLSCLIQYIRLAFNDYIVEFDGRVINNLDDHEILNIIVNSLIENKEELVHIVQGETNVSEHEIINTINSFIQLIRESSGIKRRKSRKNRSSRNRRSRKR
jgi:hypothetical protein